MTIAIHDRKGKLVDLRGADLSKAHVAGAKAGGALLEGAKLDRVEGEMRRFAGGRGPYR